MMDASEWERRLDRLLAVMERMAQQQAPTINVNVQEVVAQKKKRSAVSSPETEGDVPEPGGQPRPWVS